MGALTGQALTQSLCSWVVARDDVSTYMGRVFEPNIVHGRVSSVDSPDGYLPGYCPERETVLAAFRAGNPLSLIDAFELGAPTKLVEGDDKKQVLRRNPVLIHVDFASQGVLIWVRARSLYFCDLLHPLDQQRYAGFIAHNKDMQERARANAAVPVARNAAGQ